MIESKSDAEWTTIATAAKASGLPVRTVYNWVKAGALQARTEGHVTLVSLEDVRSRATQRKRLSPSEQPLATLTTMAEQPVTRSGTTSLTKASSPDATSLGPMRAANLASASAPNELTPKLMKVLIGRFEAGDSLPRIAAEFELPTGLALEARRQYELLVKADGVPNPESGFATQVRKRLELIDSESRARDEALEYRFDQVTAFIHGNYIQLAMEAASLAAVDELSRKVDDHSRQLLAVANPGAKSGG
jgi:hypothetical protein